MTLVAFCLLVVVACLLCVACLVPGDRSVCCRVLFVS